MTQERKEKILIVLTYNCVMLAMAFAAFAFSMWLLISGRLAREGVDAVFLFSVGLVVAGTFCIVPALSIRDGMLRDLRELYVKRRGTVCRVIGNVRARCVSLRCTE